MVPRALLNAVRVASAVENITVKKRRPRCVRYVMENKFPFCLDFNASAFYTLSLYTEKDCREHVSLSSLLLFTPLRDVS